jgi:predicted ATP-dependent serine protease
MVAERLRLKNGFCVGQDVMVSDLLNHADYLKKQHKGKQIFLLQDSLQTLDDGKYTNAAGESLGTNGASPMRCTEMLTNWAKTTSGIVVFIGQVNKNGVFSGKNGILHAVDVKGHLAIDKDKDSDTFGERVYEVTKNRYGVSGKSYVMAMGDRGISEKRAST